MYEAIGILFLSGLSEVLNHELDHHEMQVHEIKDILQIYDEWQLMILFENISL